MQKNREPLVVMRQGGVMGVGWSDFSEPKRLGGTKMLLICPRTHPLVAFVFIHGGGSAIDDRHPLWGLLIRLVGLFLQQRVDFITAHTVVCVGYGAVLQTVWQGAAWRGVSRAAGEQNQVTTEVLTKTGSQPPW